MGLEKNKTLFKWVLSYMFGVNWKKLAVNGLLIMLFTKLAGAGETEIWKEAKK